MHPSRLKTFAAAILGAMSSGNCQQYSLSRMLESPTCKSGIRRIERLFQKQELTCSSLALFLVEAELNKAGNSNTNERIDLIQQFIDIFGQGRIKSLSADREFVGKIWCDYLVRNKIPFYMRHRINIKIPYGTETLRCIGDFFDHLKPNQTRVLYKRMYEEEVCFIGKRLKNGELLIILTNQTHRNEADILNEYRKRWSIEELFKKLKTSGFH